MPLRLKHILLIAGIFLLASSFLFFGRLHNLYMALSLGGAVLAGIGFLILILQSGPLKDKLKWTVVLVLAVGLEQLLEPMLIDTSYRIYLFQRREDLDVVNRILLTKRDVFIMGDSVTSRTDTFSHIEKVQLLTAKKALGTYMITRSENYVYFGLWGFLDERVGLTYWTAPTGPDVRYRRLEGLWFH